MILSFKKRLNNNNLLNIWLINFFDMKNVKKLISLRRDAIEEWDSGDCRHVQPVANPH